MGLQDLVEQSGGVVSDSPYRTYGKHPLEDKLWEWFDEIEDEFPVEIECDFIEVSPNIEKAFGRAYKKVNPDGYHIRFSSFLVDNYSEETVKMVLIHEMAHLYAWQNTDQKIKERSHVFTYLLGMLGGSLSRASHLDEWEDLIEPMLDYHYGDS